MIAGGYPALAVNWPWSPWVPEASAGKQPGTEVINGLKIPWTRGHTQARLLHVTATLSNTGLLLGGQMKLVAIDIDPAKNRTPAEQVAFTQSVLQVMKAHPAGQILCSALIRLREPGSALLLGRADMQMKKQKAKGQRGAVELLADGQHIVVDGYHPRSRSGELVRWSWRRGRAPWTVPVSELPVISAEILKSLMQHFLMSGVLGAPVPNATNTTVVNARTRTSAYEVSDRFRELLRKHDGLIKPAVREVITQIGAEGHGRHDALVGICGRLVSLKWSIQMALDFLVPLVNQHFGDGDWTREIEQALEHGQRRDLERFQQQRRKIVWTA